MAPHPFLSSVSVVSSHKNGPTLCNENVIFSSCTHNSLLLLRTLQSRPAAQVFL